MPDVEPRFKPPKRPSPGQRAKALRLVDEAIKERASYTCELPFCLNPGSQKHHRFTREDGGSDRIENLMWLCVWCHIPEVHDKPERAYANGWLLRAEPVTDFRGWLLHPEAS